MRISTIQIFNIANDSIGGANQAIAKTQEQLSTGQRVLSPSDDPVASTKILELEQNLARIDQYGKNIDIAENNLSLEESALNSVSDLLQRVREIAVQSGNTATYTEGDYQALASEVDSRLGELQNLLNTQNAAGDYIFSGYKGGSQPFVGDAQSGFSYQGSDGQVNIKISESTAVVTSDSGKPLFVDVPSAQNTVQTSENSANASNPPAVISVGQVLDQAAYDAFYPEDMVITFREDDEVNPPAKNFTITERSTGNVIQPYQNHIYVAGEEFVVNGVAVNINGSPTSGITQSPATINFGGGAVFPADFGANPASFDITVDGVTETIVLDNSFAPSNVTNATELANLINGATGNATRLANLGVTVGATGFSVPVGLNFTLNNAQGAGAALVDAATGLAVSTGVTSTDGSIQEGDQFFIDSSPNQDVLTTLARFSDAMKRVDGTQASKDYMAQIAADTLDNIDNAQTRILETRADIGARINTLDSTRDLHLDTDLVSKEIISNLRDLDYAEASTRLASQTLILEAAQASFVRVSQLTLFSRL